MKITRRHDGVAGKARLENCRIAVNCIAVLLLHSRGAIEDVREESDLQRKVNSLADFISRDQINAILNLLSSIPPHPEELTFLFEEAKIRCLR